MHELYSSNRVDLILTILKRARSYWPLNFNPPQWDLDPKKYFWSPFWTLCWSIGSIILLGTRHPCHKYDRVPGKLLLSMCPYKLLRYCDVHVTHSPFDLKITNMVVHLFVYHISCAICGLFCAFTMEFHFKGYME